MSNSDRTEVQVILDELKERGYSAAQIAQETGNRVSERTIYRWRVGDVKPTNVFHIVELRNLLNRAKALQPEPPTRIRK